MHIVVGTILYSLMYFVPTFFAILLGTDLVKSIVSLIPGWLTTGLNVATKLLTAYGLALLLSLSLKKGMGSFFFIGFLLAAYLKLSVTAVSLLGVAAALVLMDLKFGHKAAATGGGTAALDSPDDYDPLEDDDE